MAKSIRAKIKKRFRTAKRQRVDAMLVRPRVTASHQAMQRVIEGRSVRLSTPKNAFKYPNEAAAVFPQHCVMKPVDFRAENLPMAGYAFRGNRRQYNEVESEYMKNIALNTHPAEEVLAGGGAVLAKTGKRISNKEAALLATTAERPEAAALAQAGPSRASDAVGAAVEADDSMDDEEGADSAPEPVDAVDHSRLPIVKKMKRVAENRPRGKKKGGGGGGTAGSSGGQKNKKKDNAGAAMDAS